MIQVLDSSTAFKPEQSFENDAEYALVYRQDSPTLYSPGSRVTVVPGDSSPGKLLAERLSARISIWKSDATAGPPSALSTVFTTVRRGVNSAQSGSARLISPSKSLSCWSEHISGVFSGEITSPVTPTSSIKNLSFSEVPIKANLIWISAKFSAPGRENVC